ncbi:LAETG motif-containing sortase-dependent surface protein [Streptomyces palmae]|uniref:TQXA domain-containing protein n=1 Tax=Streptomyces palmae TaxID=1701085 RepID=A0A4Z0HCR8_9ACTN|nr:LAETG motif-containing sortase-dependent surface protein [Streptomyces palmae]TGB17805.1 TQXA domain-containing protein [Streptomyces palmae]
MISARRPGAARLAAAAMAAVGATMVAGPAAAVGATSQQGGATATLRGLTVYDQAVVHGEGGNQKVGAGLFEMAVENGGTIQTYGIDIHNPTQERAQYQETPWNQTPLHDNAEAGRIRWILQHSYPQINDLPALAAKARSGALTEKTAAAGTQVAIWRFSDKDKVEAVDPAAEKLADYLEKSARRLGEPKASLTLDPPAIAGRPGGRLGPITVHTNAESVTVTPAGGAASPGVRIVGKDGKPVTTAADGTRLYFDVPADAPDSAGSITVQAATKVPVGRAFVGTTRSQTQILAGSSESTVSATATVNWAKQGPIPALSTEEDCAKGGVNVTVANQGDGAYAFELAEAEHTVPAGESKTVTVPVSEDQEYRFTLTGPDGYEKTFAGRLDCRAAGTDGTTGIGSATDTGSRTSANQPVPASAGGTTAGTAAGATAETPGGEDLAETGSGGDTPLIAGVAIALVVVGGGAVFFLRRKRLSDGE